MLLWYYELVLQWSRGPVVLMDLCSCDIMLLWYYELLILWSRGPVVLVDLCACDLKLLWFYDPLICYYGTMSTCSIGPMVMWC